MKFIESWKKKKTIKSFIEKLPADLSKRYGLKEFYTVGQLESTIEKEKYTNKYQGYAFVIFLSEDNAIEKIGSIDLVRTFKEEVANLFFGGDKGFAIKLARSRKVGNGGHCSAGAIDVSGSGD